MKSSILVLDEEPRRYAGISDYSVDDIVDSCYILEWIKNSTQHMMQAIIVREVASQTIIPAVHCYAWT